MSAVAILFFFFVTSICARAPTIFITEIADPRDNSNARFVELFSPDGKSATITEDIALLRWTNANRAPTWSTSISLRNKTFNVNGFLVLCNSAGANRTRVYDGACDEIFGKGGPVDSNGDDNIAIVSVDPTGHVTIIDIFGVPGQDGTGTEHDFRGGQAERVSNVTGPSKKFKPDEWMIRRPLKAADMTPGKWHDACPHASIDANPPSTNLPKVKLPTVSIQETRRTGIKPSYWGQKINIYTGFVTQVVYNGFFIQEPVLAAESHTCSSSGIFVYTGFADTSFLQPGNAVNVEGEVTEYNGLIELTHVTFLKRNETDRLYQPVELFLPTSIETLKKCQGMVVHVKGSSSTFLAVSEYFDLDRYGTFKACSSINELGRIFQYTATSPPSVDGYAAFREKLGRSCVVIDDNNGTQNPDPVKVGSVIEVTGTRPAILRGGAEVTKMVGALYINNAFDKFYRVATDSQADLTISLLRNERPMEPPFKVPLEHSDKNNIKIFSGNILNYFITLNDGKTAARGANNRGELDRQSQKLFSALCEINADIYAVMELENINSIGASKVVAQKLSIATGRKFRSSMVASGLSRVGNGAIKVDIFYDTGMFNAITLADGDVDEGILSRSSTGTIFTDKSRQPLALTIATKASPNFEITLVANHFKSKGSGPANGPDSDHVDGAGAWNLLRTLTAEATLDWVRRNPQGTFSENIMLMGDFNSYFMEEPIQYIVNNGFTSVETLSGVVPPPYSFVFDGQWGSLDYVFVKSSMASNFLVGAKTWHVNSDEIDLLDYNLDFFRNPSLFDGTLPFRFSDHDPLVVILKPKNGQ